MKTRTKLHLVAAAAVALCAHAGLAGAQPPPGGGGDHHRKPPPAAFDACKGKKADDACEVTFREHKLAGKCAAIPDGLVCRPEHPPGPPPELLAACETKKEGEACKATLGGHEMTGTCQKTRHGDTLSCRR